MAKKVKCIDCVYRTDWAVPNGVDENNIDYTERCLNHAKNTLVCGYTMKTKAREHEQFCRHFIRAEEAKKAFEDEWLKERIERLEKQIEEFKQKKLK